AVAPSSSAPTPSSIPAPGGRASSSPRRWTASRPATTPPTACGARRSCARAVAATSATSFPTALPRRVCATASTPARWLSSERRVLPDPNEEATVGNWTIKPLDEMQDVLGDYPGEMRMATYEVGAEQVALTYRRMPAQTGGKGSYGHSHKTQEELYLVLSG